MNRDALVRLDQLVRACTDELNSANSDMKASAPDDSLSLWRMHYVAVVSEMVNRLLLPGWKEHPDLAPGAGQPEPPWIDLVLPQVAIDRGNIAADRIKKFISPLAIDAENDPVLSQGLAEVNRRLAEFEEYLQSASAPKPDPRHER